MMQRRGNAEKDLAGYHQQETMTFVMCPHCSLKMSCFYEDISFWVFVMTPLADDKANF